MTGLADLGVDFVAGLRRLHLLRDLGSRSQGPNGRSMGEPTSDIFYIKKKQMLVGYSVG